MRRARPCGWGSIADQLAMWCACCTGRGDPTTATVWQVTIREVRTDLVTHHNDGFEETQKCRYLKRSPGPFTSHTTACGQTALISCCCMAQAAKRGFGRQPGAIPRQRPQPSACPSPQIDRA